jgi:hypothetical protein
MNLVVEGDSGLRFRLNVADLDENLVVVAGSVRDWLRSRTLLPLMN